MHAGLRAPPRRHAPAQALRRGLPVERPHPDPRRAAVRAGLPPLEPPARYHPRRREAEQRPPRRRRREPARRLRDGAGGAREAAGEGGDRRAADRAHGHKHHGVHGPRLHHDRRAHHGVGRVRVRRRRVAAPHGAARPQRRRPGARGAPDGRRARRAGRVRGGVAGGAGRALAQAGAQVLQPGQEAAPGDHVRRGLEAAPHPKGHGNAGQ
jgi:hypothetical protein